MTDKKVLICICVAAIAGALIGFGQGGTLQSCSLGAGLGAVVGFTLCIFAAIG